MKSNNKLIVIALMLAMFLGAVEGTIVTTAIPTIAKSLQGFEIISFVFSVYLLTSAISTPVYGKLSDLYGRKNVLSIGIIIFLFGSFLCGLAQTMYMLIGFRAVQGLGAGAIFTVTYTIVGDIFTLEERTKVQGAISSVWGIASLVGPFLGGLIIDSLSWHWIFFINIPFGILAIILLQKNLSETFEKKKHSIDFLGIITLSFAMIIFLNIFLSAESSHIFIIVSVVLTILFLLVFYKVERKAKEPIIPFDIFSKSSTIINLISFLISAILIGLDVYMPIYIQNILGYNAKISGLSLAPMSVSWILSSMILGKLIIKYGRKVAILMSNIIIFISSILLATLGIKSSIIFILLYVFIIGFGFGGAFTVLTIVIQESVELKKRGVATATNSLVRTLGQTIGVSIFGSIFNFYIVKYFESKGMSDVNPSNLYKAASCNAGVTNTQIKLSLNSSLHVLFILFIIISAMAIILSIVMPKLKQEPVK